jgi:2-polyprenyl-3-methyl-5-hydroxy-6-metoxy-1,4-benzoquinol methylase
MLWFWQEPRRYRGDDEALERLFRLRPDPWGFARDPYEQARLARLLEAARLVRPASILEVGCAEGALTMSLAAECGRVVALDVSATACARARSRAPGATVLARSVDELPPPDEPFDLVICAETIYYVKDPRRTLETLERLGRHVLLSYTLRESRRIDPLVAARAGQALVDEEQRLVVWRLPRWTRGFRLLLWRTGR